MWVPCNQLRNPSKSTPRPAVQLLHLGDAMGYRAFNPQLWSQPRSAQPPMKYLRLADSALLAR